MDLLWRRSLPRRVNMLRLLKRDLVVHPLGRRLPVLLLSWRSEVTSSKLLKRRWLRLWLTMGRMVIGLVLRRRRWLASLEVGVRLLPSLRQRCLTGVRRGGRPTGGDDDPGLLLLHHVIHPVLIELRHLRLSVSRIGSVAGLLISLVRRHSWITVRKFN